MTDRFDIVGYTYRAHNYCPGCIVAMAREPADRLPAVDGMDAEQALDHYAAILGVDREDERSFDSGYFPKVIFSDQTEEDESCGECGEPL